MNFSTQSSLRIIPTLMTKRLSISWVQINTIMDDLLNLHYPNDLVRCEIYHRVSDCRSGIQISSELKSTNSVPNKLSSVSWLWTQYEMALSSMICTWSTSLGYIRSNVSDINKSNVSKVTRQHFEQGQIGLHINLLHLNTMIYTENYFSILLVRV